MRTLVTRRRFLQAALTATVATSTQGCRRAPRGATASRRTRSSRRALLTILQGSHSITGYDRWFDTRYIERWGRENDVDVTVDHVPVGRLVDVAAAEAAAQSGHDVVAFLAPPAVFEDQVIDHRDIVDEAQGRFGGMTGLAQRSTYNPRTGKYFGFCDNWAPAPVLWRTDLWGALGAEPVTWGDVLSAAPKLKLAGHPIGIGMGQDLDSNMALLSLMACFGSFVQDDRSTVVLNRPATIEVVKFAAALFRNGMNDEIFGWDSASNNRFLEAGRGSLIVNPISALRSAQRNQPELAESIGVAAIPDGPAGRLAMPGAISIYSIWKFARNPEPARRFLVDLASNSRQVLHHTELMNLPSLEGVVPELGRLLLDDPGSRPAGKLAALADASAWSTNVGHPGHANPAIGEVVNKSLIPQMFAMTAKRQASAAEAVKWADDQIRAIYEGWRERGRI